MYLITFLRHGESEGNADGILQGQSDYPLTLKGECQAKALAERWKIQDQHFEGIISSPLKRAARTAQIVAEALGLEVEYDPVWMERYFSALEGRPIDELVKMNPPVDFHHPFEQLGGNGESEVDLYLRACRGVQELLRRPASSYLVIAHGAILNMALYACLGLAPQGKIHSIRFRLGNTAYVNLRYDSSVRQWWLVNLVNPEMIFPADEQ